MRPIRLSTTARRIGCRTAETSELLVSAEVKACELDGWTEGENTLVSSSRKL
jgi:hypothetical protein